MGTNLERKGRQPDIALMLVAKQSTDSGKGRELLFASNTPYSNTGVVSEHTQYKGDAMNTHYYWEQLTLPIDIGPTSSDWKCPNCNNRTVLVVKYQNKDIYLHARTMCVKHKVSEK